MDDSSSLDVRLYELLEKRKKIGTYRSLKEYKTVETASQRTLSVQEQLVDFSSNDYVSLTHSPYLRERYLERLQRCQDPLFGSTGSRLLDGTSPHHSALENRLARFFAYRTDSGRVDQTAALLFNSGYDANVSFFSTIPQKGDYIVHDELVHASVWDGMRANERRGVPQQDRFSFRHNSVKHLELALREIVKRENTRCGTGMIYVGIESLYSMDGDVPPLKAIIALLNKLGRDHPRVINKERIHIILDEAHTTGIWGPKGRGLACSVQEDQWDTETLETDNIVKVEDWVKVRIMTFGKGVGGQGSVLIGSPLVRQFLINYARPFIFSTAMSVNNVLAIESAWDVLESAEGDQRRQELFRLCDLFRSQITDMLQRNNLPTSILSLPSGPQDETESVGRATTYIVPLITSQPHSLATQLRAAGYLTRPVVHPTVPKGKERVRVCLHAGNRSKDVAGLVLAIEIWARGQQQSPDGTLRAKL